jgi:hypothetical protein
MEKLITSNIKKSKGKWRKTGANKYSFIYISILIMFRNKTKKEEFE